MGNNINTPQSDYVCTFFKNTSSLTGEAKFGKWIDFCAANVHGEPQNRKSDSNLYGNFIVKPNPPLNANNMPTHRIVSAIDFYTMAVLDFDENVPEDIIEFLISKFPDNIILIYSTWSHTNTKWKVRAVLPVSEKVYPKDYAKLQKNLMAYVGLDIDKCSYAQAHLYYFAAVQPGVKPIYYHHEGKNYTLIVEDWLQATYYQEYENKKTDGYSHVDMSSLLREEFSEWFIPTAYPNRFLAVNSQSKSPGVVVKPNGTVFINHTQALPKLAQRYLDAYDLALELKFNGDIDKTISWLNSKGIHSSKQGGTKLKLNKKDNTLTKITQVVKHDTLLKGLLSWDIFKERMVLTRDYINTDGYIVGRKGQAVYENVYDSIVTYVKRDHNLKSPDTEILKILKEDSYNRSFDEVRNWITNPPHDTKDRLGVFWEKAGVPQAMLENDFIKVSLQKWMVGNIDMLFGNPQKGFDGFLLLVGESGTGKSHMAHCFGHKWEYTTSLATVQGNNKKDEYMNFNESIVVNFDEFETFNKRDDQTVKELTSKPKLMYRAPYERLPKEHQRKWGYMGTSNTMELIRDSAVSRRLWIILIGVDYQDKIPFMDEMLDDYYRQQLWAQAYAMWKSQYDYQLTSKERLAKDHINENYQEDNEWAWHVIEVLTRSDKSPRMVSVDEVLNEVYQFGGELQKLPADTLSKKRAEVRESCKKLGLTIMDKVVKINGKSVRPWTASNELFLKLIHQKDGKDDEKEEMHTEQKTLDYN